MISILPSRGEGEDRGMRARELAAFLPTLAFAFASVLVSACGGEDPYASGAPPEPVVVSAPPPPEPEPEDPPEPEPVSRETPESRGARAPVLPRPETRTVPEPPTHVENPSPQRAEEPSPASSPSAEKPEAPPPCDVKCRRERDASLLENWPEFDPEHPQGETGGGGGLGTWAWHAVAGGGTTLELSIPKVRPELLPTRTAAVLEHDPELGMTENEQMIADMPDPTGLSLSCFYSETDPETGDAINRREIIFDGRASRHNGRGRGIGLHLLSTGWSKPGFLLLRVNGAYLRDGTSVSVRYVPPAENEDWTTDSTWGRFETGEFPVESGVGEYDPCKNPCGIDYGDAECH